MSTALTVRSIASHTFADAGEAVTSKWSTFEAEADAFEVPAVEPVAAKTQEKELATRVKALKKDTNFFINDDF